MKNEIMVSIICNTYNHQNYIDKSIKSFLMQKTDFKYEILIHDDASTDKTVEIIKRYAIDFPELIKPIYQEENQFSKKVNVSQKYQYSRAKGKYIAFCEGDDYWINENKIQKQVDFLEKNVEYIACVHKYIVVDEEDKKQDTKKFGYYEKSGDYSLNDFCSKELPSQLASLMCRNIFCNPNMAYPSNFNIINLQGDIKLILYLLAHGDIYRMDNVMSAYRFVYKFDGTSWSSRSIKEVNGFIRWKAVKHLEHIFYEVYNIRIYLLKRRIDCAMDTIRDLRKYPTIYTLNRAIIVLLCQRGLFSKICEEKIKKDK